MAKLIALLLLCSIFIATATAACTNGSDGCDTCANGNDCATCKAGYYSKVAKACSPCEVGSYQSSTTSAANASSSCIACTLATSTGSTTCFSANIVFGAVLGLFALLF